MTRRTAKYLAALKAVKEKRMPIRNTENTTLYAALHKAGYCWNTETGSWEISCSSLANNNFDPSTGLVKLRIIAARKFAVDIGEVLEGMLERYGFQKVNGPSISPSRKKEEESLLYFTFKLPGYDKAFEK